MDTVQSLQDRLRFIGLPPTPVAQVAAAVRAGGAWARACDPHVRRARDAANAAGREGRPLRAAAWWLRLAAWQHASAFDLHRDRPRRWRPEPARAWRAAAATAFQRAIDAAGLGLRRVRIPHRRTGMDGYVLASGDRRASVVVLVNGLDSICECELFRLARRLRRSHLDVLMLDVPAGYASGVPCLRIDRRAASIADWVERETGARRAGAMGVSFGGHLAARLASGDSRFTRAVLVSPNAWLDPRRRLPARLQRMVAVTLAGHSARSAHWRIPCCDIRRVPAPGGQLLLYAMTRDALFGAEHERAFSAWAGAHVHIRHLDAEHAGTSRMKAWLPAAARWLSAGGRS